MMEGYTALTLNYFVDCDVVKSIKVYMKYYAHCTQRKLPRRGYLSIRVVRNNEKTASDQGSLHSSATHLRLLPPVLAGITAGMRRFMLVPLEYAQPSPITLYEFIMYGEKMAHFSDLIEDISA